MADTVEEQFFIGAMTPAAREDPYPHYEAYRGSEPLMQAADTIWFCLSHPHVTAMLRNPVLSSNEMRATTEIAASELSAEKAQQSLLFMDPPDHTRLRGLVSRAFTPRRVRGMRETIGQICATLLDDILASVGPGEPFDVIDRLAYPLPVQVICSLLGIPATDEAVFTGWSRALSRSIDPSVLLSAEHERACATRGSSSFSWRLPTWSPAL